MKKVDNVRINSRKKIDSPNNILQEIAISDRSAEVVSATRNDIHQVLQGLDDRLVVIAGPCSIHDIKAGIEYAEKLLPYKNKFCDDLIVVMRVYFEKPRTTVGWKGLINDPDLNESFDINKGVRLARGLLQEINDIGLPAGTEFLDLISPQYMADLISWGAIGARTTESQGHRELASGLSCPVGFKNGTKGSVQIATDAIKAASKSHHFLSISKDGEVTIFQTTGNEDCHLILRGGERPNYDRESVFQAVSDLKNRNTQEKLMIDFSHANSHKMHENQLIVCDDVGRQIADGDQSIMGVMIESNLVEGKQDLNHPDDLVYGQSITDSCVNFEDTVLMLEKLASAVRKRREI